MSELFGCITFLAALAFLAWVVRAARWLRRTQDAGDKLAEQAYVSREIQYMDGLFGTGENWEGRR